MSRTRTIKQAAIRLRSLAIFNDVLQTPLLQELLALLDDTGRFGNRRVDLYCRFVARLYENGGDFGDHLLLLVLESENPAVRSYGARKPLPGVMEDSLQQELETLTFLSSLSPQALADYAGGRNHHLPEFDNTRHDFTAVYTRRLAEVETRGYGIFAKYHMFNVDEEGQLKAVKNPDGQRLSDLTGYEREREQVLINTRALLRGLPAANILLYGDAGTGKSSTVKAVGNEYSDRGLRLVEIRKNQIYSIPALMDSLAENPLKFILFIDDLSFPDNDADFTALKAILEGNVSARPDNLVVYATSNRRHMMRQQFSDRQGDDVHLSDTLEEQASLAARFGLTVTFLKPDAELYADIVRNLAQEYNLRTPVATLVKESEKHALRHGGRSPRVAKQFIEYAKAREEDGMGARRG